MQQLLNDFVFHALGSVASFAKVLSTPSSTPGHGNRGRPAPQDSPPSSLFAQGGAERTTHPSLAFRAPRGV